MWQVLVDELERFTVISVALDSDREAAARYIRRYRPTFPALIDERHLVAELCGMVNVPSAIWIDEEGQVARPTHIAGMGEAWRTETDRSSATRQMSEEGNARMHGTRDAYTAAVRRWVLEGKHERREPLPDAGDSAAHAHFRLATYLHECGLAGASEHFAEAVRLRPCSWNFRRQALALEQPDDLWRQFWDAVDATPPGQYYPLEEDL
ncbi:MAG: hypothetical protein H0V40_10125 [Actinobacteria bacterium]|nr:hypothetical protein [Actinomycetota bacterium]